jgi:hypothetical protein
MDISLGPWIIAPSVPSNLRGSMPAIMADEAASQVKRAGHTPKVAPPGKPGKGYTISGTLRSLVTQGASVTVSVQCDIAVDGAMSGALVGPTGATADGGSTAAEDAVRAALEGQFRTILKAIKAGQVKALGQGK